MTVYTKQIKKSENRKIYKKEDDFETLGIIAAIIVFISWVGLMFFMFENLIFN